MHLKRVAELVAEVGGEPELHRQRHEALLRAVVQIALEPDPFLVGGDEEPVAGPDRLRGVEPEQGLVSAEDPEEREDELPEAAEDSQILEITSANGYASAMIAVVGRAMDENLRVQTATRR